MIKSIAVYPVAEPDQYSQQWEAYLDQAARYGFGDVFTTAHLPEMPLTDQIDSLVRLGEITHRHQMELTVDVGGGYLRAILDDPALLAKVATAQVDYLRLDCNYCYDEVARLAEKLNLKGFQINASSRRPEELEAEIAFIRSLPSGPYAIRGCHNFYPRQESGLDDSFAMMQDQFFKEKAIPVMYCVPSQSHPRGPIYKGLPTLESQRFADMTQIMLELIYDYQADGILLADECYEESAFAACCSVLEGKPVPVRVQFYAPYFSERVIGPHRFRYDSNERFLRSETSRSMAELGEAVEPFNTSARRAGSITVDNQRYARYSGEVQVVLADAPADERVNVVGYVWPEDLDKLAYFREGLCYVFVPAERA